MMTQETQEMLDTGRGVGNHHMGAVVFPLSIRTKTQQRLHAGAGRSSGLGAQISRLHTRPGRFPRTTHCVERLAY